MIPAANDLAKYAPPNPEVADDSMACLNQS
jgi:hypothetical protein